MYSSQQQQQTNSQSNKKGATNLTGMKTFLTLSSFVSLSASWLAGWLTAGTASLNNVSSFFTSSQYQKAEAAAASSKKKQTLLVSLRN